MTTRLTVGRQRDLLRTALEMAWQEIEEISQDQHLNSADALRPTITAALRAADSKYAGPPYEGRHRHLCPRCNREWRDDWTDCQTAYRNLCDYCVPVRATEGV